MTHRTTFALDEATTQRLKGLSALWKVSQAEVVRRSIAQAEETAELEGPDSLTLFRQLHERGGGLDPEVAEAYLAEVYQDRKQWRSHDLS